MQTKEFIVFNGVKTKYLLISIAIIFTFLGIVSFSNSALAQEQAAINDSGIQYPIAELGNCANKAACGVYCDKPKNEESCINFAEKNKMMSEDEIKAAKNFAAAGSKGPGGCASKDSCEAYCNDISRIDECVSFAEKNNLMPPAELAEAKKVQAAITRGVKPPSCGNRKQCDAYCEEPDHMEECINFGAEAGFMRGKELEDAKKMLAAIKKGVKPPPCKGKEACDEYCSVSDNLEVCINFASEAGFMSEEEKVNSQKMLQAVKKGVKPPNCRGKEKCDAYCGQEEHFEECVSFAEAAGFMSGEDAVMARKTKGKGPGDCKGKDECEAFCNNPDNQETCFNFAKENGMIPEEDLKKMEEGKQGMRQAMQQAPPAVIDCLNSELGAGAVEKLKTGKGAPSKEIGEKLKSCFEKSGSPQGERKEDNMMPSGQSGQFGQPGQSGPGGCKNPEECKAYCRSNQDECQKFQPNPGAVNPGEQMMPRQSGPGGCKSPEECQKYCVANPEECQKFSPGSGGSGGVSPQGQIPFSPPSSDSQSQPQRSQDQYNYPVPKQTQLPCAGEDCQFAPPPDQTMGRPPEGNTFTPPPPPNIPGFFGEPPVNTQPPPAGQLPPIEQQQPPVGQQPYIEQQQPPQPLPGNPPPTSFNLINLLSFIPKILSLLLS